MRNWKEIERPITLKINGHGQGEVIDGNHLQIYSGPEYLVQAFVECVNDRDRLLKKLNKIRSAVGIFEEE